jgi:N-hydroxyarylamine O-acetyltransferase
VFELDRYLARVGLSGRPGIAEVHRAHITAIPFENLDPHRGLPVSVAIDDIEDKLVTQRRGGYCFEHNLLLGAALEALGAEVDLFLARVRVGARDGKARPRSHLVLRVVQDGEVWHADVGFGAGSPMEPLPFGPGISHDQSGWRFRVVQDGDELVLQTASDGDWSDLYGFVPQPVPLIDVEVSNWFTSTHPRSPFVTGLIVSAQLDDGRRMRLSDWEGLALTEQTPDGSSVIAVAPEAVPDVLAERFGLNGFALGEGDRIVRVGGG